MKTLGIASIMALISIGCVASPADLDDDLVDMDGAEDIDRATQALASGQEAVKTQVSGTLAGTTTWTLQGSPYLITSNVFVPAGSTLIVEPGVVVRVEPDYHNGIVVEGAMIAVGTAQQRITFTASWDQGICGQTGENWPGIILGNDGDMTLSYVDVKYAGQLGPFNAGLTVGKTGSFMMDHSTVRYSKTDGIKFRNNGFATASKISDSYIGNNVRHGISVYSGFVQMLRSRVEGNGVDGIYQNSSVYSGAPMWVMNSDIVNNGSSGIYMLSYATAPLQHQSFGHQNNIYGNGGKQIGVFAAEFLQNGPSPNGDLVDWSDNYFGDNLVQNGCPWSTAPSYKNFHLGPLHDNICKAPPQGPIQHRNFTIQVPQEVCSNGIAYCGVDQVNTSPHVASRISNGAPKKAPPEGCTIPL